MLKSLRVALAVVLAVGGVLLALFVLSSPKPAAPSEGLVFTSAAQCAGCHGEIAREVAASYHGMAFTDPEALALSHNFQDEQCISCHAPAPVFRTGVDKRVLERKEGRETGVDCLSCHLLPNGGVAGLRGLSAPCRPEVEPRLGAAVFCSGCHNQHWTVDEYMASGYAETHTCNDCHMPRSDRPLVDGGPVRTGVASHLFPGGHDPGKLREALSLAVSVESGTLKVSVTNRGAGHKVPTDSRHKSVNVYVSLTDEDGNVLIDRRELAEYRLYYRTDNIESSQLLPRETREIRLDLPADRRGTARVELVYCLKPPQKETRDWTLVQEEVVPF
ncbi:MAG: NapC/NirT family cytochrome c [Planctomycetes bacterium]|jgi:hypothetical protein|nr:NapC/NirT family cytochrome c [Planctomycetota bacterium]